MIAASRILGGGYDEVEALVADGHVPPMQKWLALASAVIAIAVMLIAWSVRRDKVTRTSAPAQTQASQPGQPPPLAAVTPAPQPDPTQAQQIDQEPIIAHPPAKPVTGKPRPSTPRPGTSTIQPAPTGHAPTSSEVADLYARVGRELTAAARVDPHSTIDLWPRYRWIRIMDAIKTPARRQATAALLEKLRADLKTIAP